MTAISANSGSACSSLAGSSSAAREKARPAAAFGATSGSSTDSNATRVTFSDAAKAALALNSFDTVVAETRTGLDKLIAAQKPAGKRAPDLASLGRRALFAVAANTGSKFTDAEQAAAKSEAKSEAKSRQDGALAGPLTLARVTDDVDGLYRAAIGYLEAASSEEKATPAWTVQKDAVLKAQKALATDPNTMPTVAGDIVADYITRATAGETATPRDFSAIAGDARAALDRQHADAKEAGKKVVFHAAQNPVSRSTSHPSSAVRWPPSRSTRATASLQARSRRPGPKSISGPMRRCLPASRPQLRAAIPPASPRTSPAPSAR